MREVVIKIPEEEYEVIVNSEDCGLHTLTRAIAKGTPLPKGHGRLIDADELNRTHKGDNWDLHKVLNNAPTVLEANKENKDADSEDTDSN